VANLLGKSKSINLKLYILKDHLIAQIGNDIPLTFIIKYISNLKPFKELNLENRNPIRKEKKKKGEEIIDCNQ
jgi:hypothetical protein